MTPTRRRATAQWFQDTFGISGVRACRLAVDSRAAWYRKSIARDQSAIRLRIRELAQARPRVGTDLKRVRPEFTSMALDTWAFEPRITLDFTRPGKLTDNGHIESFNARLRDECLTLPMFRVSLAHAKAIIDAWRVDDNEHRPHGSLGDLTPSEYATSHQDTMPSAAA